ncbi:hypothetical protein [Aliivibrio salmonicida]|jgi:hypothetical protein|uniref:Uncharacterized protein n=1 Tax=Aliivibrio salmonicida (strain LFI1238) TaxID=316275 RepID=B6ESC3_ALISL|nr:hypothetical protein [Aliivibrio salmonicida]AZL86927.1 hypothetical protein EIJ81_21855 [Aliivibrio salmonicida]CAQ81610.1 hypothetical protein VSAL_II0856 [Aliivibrio salmonicida LFI1238]
MNLIDFTFSDRKILKQLQIQGMTINEAIRSIMCDIYYLNYKDRAIMRAAIRLVGEERKDQIITNIQFSKRKQYMTEIR